MRNNICVYRHRRLDTNDIFYVGVGSIDRAYSKDPNKRNIIWNRIVNKTDYEVEIIYKNLTKELAFELEMFLISLYGRKNIKTGILCNLTDGGEGSFGYKPTLETRLKISKRNKGRVVSEATRLKMRLAKKDMFLLENNPRAKKVINIETGVIYNTLKEAALSINKKYSSFKWSIKNAKNFKFQYYNE